jgi:hypothetical protein
MRDPQDTPGTSADGGRDRPVGTGRRRETRRPGRRLGVMWSTGEIILATMSTSEAAINESDAVAYTVGEETTAMNGIVGRSLAKTFGSST